MGSSKKHKRGDRASVEEEVNTAKKSNMVESEGANGLFSEKELSLHEIKELLINIHLLRKSKSNKEDCGVKGLYVV